MKQHPILFCGEMVRAILEDRKHQTRRMHGLEDVNNDDAGRYRFLGMQWKGAHFYDILKGIHIWFEPKYQPGDRLWVKETFRVCDECRTLNFAESVNEAHYYKSRLIGQCSGCDETIAKWTPSIFMPRCYSRISLEVENVRCQRVQDISEYDAVDDGVNLAAVEAFKARDAFGALWQSINDNWDANPYVFAYTFKKL